MRARAPALPVRRGAVALTLRDRVEKQWIGRQGLAPVLRAKTEEDDATFAHRDFDQCSFAFDAIAAEQPAGKQRIFVAWIRRNYVNRRDRSHLVCRVALA